MMNIRRIAIPIFALLLSPFAPGQQAPASGDEIGPSARVEANAASVFKQQLVRQIALQEEGLRKAEAAHATDVELARRYARLGVSYGNLAEWARSEAAVEHAVSLVRHAPEQSEELAGLLTQLGSLHLAMGKLRDSEKEELEGLKLREKLGDRLQIARTYNDLAELLLAQKKFDKARDIAQKAVAEFVENKQASVFDRIVARSVLSMAMCYLKDCPSAIPLLKGVIDEAKTKLRPDDFPIGLSDFLLGYAYWKSGNMSEAGPHMQDGTAAMSRQLGWGHPAYLSALKHYEQFLRENRQVEAADVIQRRIRQAEAVVDVHSIQSAQGMIGIDGLH
jgi:tetratricopeptide (TPR) repeat protein